MTIVEALILGLVQGLTEFLPISSSGHLELGHYFLKTENKENLLFAVIVHGATALSTVVVFRKDIQGLLTDFFQFRWNEGTKYVSKLLVSTLPVAVVGLLFEDEIEAIFSGNIVFVASMLLITGMLLLSTRFFHNHRGSITFGKSVIIGIAQAVAILPGISRSGATISTSLFLGVKKEEAARFSFLMVLIPILGAMTLKTRDILMDPEPLTQSYVSTLGVGFLAGFLSGLVACRWMVRIVKSGNLAYFAIYCFLVAIAVFIFSII